MRLATQDWAMAATTIGLSCMRRMRPPGKTGIEFENNEIKIFIEMLK